MKQAAFVKTANHMLSALGIGFIAYKMLIEGTQNELAIRIKIASFFVMLIIWLVYWKMEHYYMSEHMERAYALIKLKKEMKLYAKAK